MAATPAKPRLSNPTSTTKQTPQEAAHAIFQTILSFRRLRREIPPNLEPPPRCSRGNLRAAHIKKANIEARLVAANVGGIPLDWGYDAMADALEFDIAVLYFEIPAVRKWTEVTGKELYQGPKGGKDSWALSKKRDMGRGDGRMSLSRWQFWEGECQERGEAVGDAGKGAVEEIRKFGVRGNETLEGLGLLSILVVGNWIWYQEYSLSSRLRKYITSIHYFIQGECRNPLFFYTLFIYRFILNPEIYSSVEVGLGLNGCAGHLASQRLNHSMYWKVHQTNTVG